MAGGGSCGVFENRSEEAGSAYRALRAQERHRGLV